VLQGLGTALILAIVEQVRDRDEQTRAAASRIVYFRPPPICELASSNFEPSY
jgi:hypothetical protein